MIRFVDLRGQDIYPIDKEDGDIDNVFAFFDTIKSQFLTFGPHEEQVFNGVDEFLEMTHTKEKNPKIFKRVMGLVPEDFK